MALRYTYEGEPFDGAWVEFSEAWTQREMRTYMDTQGDQLVALLRAKITACALGGLTGPDALTDEALDALDWRLWRWLASALSKAAVDVARLGEAPGRRLWGISDEAAGMGNPSPATAAPGDPTPR